MAMHTISHNIMGASWLFRTGFTAEPTIKGSSSFGPAILSLIASTEGDICQLHSIKHSIMFLFSGLIS